MTQTQDDDDYADEYTLDDSDNEDDDIMRNHKMLASDDSPYANTAELSFIRAVSVGKPNSI